MFNYSPTLTNYNQYLTSKNFTGIYSPQQLLKYDIYLSNYSTTNENTLAVELWDGATWHVLKTYTNMNGNISWTSETLDISAYNDITFKIRFHAAGVDSYDINNWNIDNIYVLAGDGSTGYNPCVLGYNFYLNGVQSAFTTDTTYNIPPNQVQYGQTYNACVNAVYGSGYSTQSCYTFTAHFLYPPNNLQVEGIECNAYLTWEQPAMLDAIRVPAFDGIVEHTTPDAGRAPIDLTQKTGFTNSSPLSGGVIAFGADGISDIIVDFDIANVSGMTTIATNSAPDFLNGFAMMPGVTDWAYAVNYGGGNLYQVDRATGALTTVGSLGSTGFNDITVDPTTSILYGTDGSSLYTIDPSVPSVSLVGSHGGAANLMIGITCDNNGQLWAYDIGNDLFFSLDKTTGVATTIGSLGFNANYAQSAFYDPIANTVLLAAYNLGNSQCEIRAVDVTTGASVILSNASNTELTASALPLLNGGGGLPPGLIGYNVYRDGAFIAYVSGPDTTWYYDLNLDPDTYEYAVTAVYDLTDYGFPGPVRRITHRRPAVS